MKEIIKPNAKGHLKLWLIDKDGKITVLYDDHNAIVADAETIMRNCISGYSTPVDAIVAYKSGGVLASKTVGEEERAFVSTNGFTFTTLFTFADFNDTLDELRLESSIVGSFSEVTGLDISKSSEEQLGISWTITFNV